MWRGEGICRVGGKGKKAELCFYTFNGLWRNLPVRLELGEEEPVGCGTPDKGDIYTLTLDYWSERRGKQLESFIFPRRRRSLTSGLLLFLYFGKLFFQKGTFLCFSAVWIHL